MSMAGTPLHFFEDRIFEQRMILTVKNVTNGID